LPDQIVTMDNPPEGFRRIDFDQGRAPTFNSHIGTLYCKRGPKGTRDEFVMGFRVHRHMCNPADGLHGGMMMSVADLVGTMGGGTLVGLRKFLPTVSMTFDFVAPAKVGDWVEGRAEVVRQTRSLLFTSIYLGWRGEDPARLAGRQDPLGRRARVRQGAAGSLVEFSVIVSAPCHPERSEGSHRRFISGNAIPGEAA